MSTEDQDQVTGPGRSLSTVEVVNPCNPYKILRINASDFDPEKYVPAEAKNRTLSAQESALMEKISAKYEDNKAKLPAAMVDHRDLAISKLERELAEVRALLLANKPASPEIPAPAPKAEAQPAAPTSKGSSKAKPNPEPQDSLAALKDL